MTKLQKPVRAGCSSGDGRGPAGATAEWMDGWSRLLSNSSGRKKIGFLYRCEALARDKPRAKGFANNKAADLKLDKLRVEKRRWFGSAEQRLL